jgi:hypothetical protein
MGRSSRYRRDPMNSGPMTRRCRDISARMVTTSQSHHHRPTPRRSNTPRPTLVPGEAPTQGVAPAPARPYQPSSSQDSPAKYGTKSAGALAGYRRLIPALVPTSAQQVLSAVVTMKRTRSRHTADVPQFCRPAASQFYLRNSSMAVSCLVTPVMYMCKSKCQRTNGLHMWSTSRIWPLIATVDAALLPKSDRVCVLPRA